MHRIVVSDTTAITHLARINALHILKFLYHEILIPTALKFELFTVIKLRADTPVCPYQTSRR